MKLDFEKARPVFATAMRIVLGWHLLYLGYWALTTPGGFSYAGRFRCAHWVFGGFFRSVAASAAMPAVDVVVTALAVVAGLMLVLGWRVRWAAALGTVYFVLCYLLNPPHFGHTGDSHFLFVNRDAIEVLMLLAAAAVPGVGVLEGVRRFKARGLSDGGTEVDEDRRRMLAGLASLPVVAAFGGAAAWTRLIRSEDVVRITGPAVKPFDPAVDVAGLGHRMTAFGRIGGVNLSRIILGGNVIGGWAHGRDMHYYDKLVKAYHTDERVFRTFRIAEACGVNTILTNPALMRVINRYWREEGGRIQFISDCGWDGGDLIRGAEASIENGASMVYAHGGFSDNWGQAGDWKKFREYLDEVRKFGVPTGIGCHNLNTVKLCVEHDCIPDFWMKTVHRLDYPTARFKKECDNVFSYQEPEEVFAYMASRPEPWIAFKILGAGITHPKDAFPAAFKGGADFACVGMYDYQIVEDVNIANNLFENGLPGRQRPWHG